MSLLTIKRLSKSFGGLKALNDVNLTVERGAAHAIIGPNGAGKSTLLNALVGRLIPDEGLADFAGQSLLGKRPQDVNQMGIARVFQTPEIFGSLTLLENVMIPALAQIDGEFSMNIFANAYRRDDIRALAFDELECVGLKGREAM